MRQDHSSACRRRADPIAGASEPPDCMQWTRRSPDGKPRTCWGIRRNVACAAVAQPLRGLPAGGNAHVHGSERTSPSTQAGSVALRPAAGSRQARCRQQCCTAGAGPKAARMLPHWRRAAGSGWLSSASFTHRPAAARPPRPLACAARGGMGCRAWRLDPSGCERCGCTGARHGRALEPADPWQPTLAAPRRLGKVGFGGRRRARQAPPLTLLRTSALHTTAETLIRQHPQPGLPPPSAPTTHPAPGRRVQGAWATQAGRQASPGCWRPAP